MGVLNITTNNFKEEVINSDKPVLLDFWAPWCGPCQMVGPIIEEIGNEVENVKVCKINVDEQKKLAFKYRVMSIPTLLVINNGKVVNKSIGAKSKDDILSMLKV